MKNKFYLKVKGWNIFILFIFVLALFVKCEAESDGVFKGHTAVHDPSKAVTFTSFSPDSGGVTTQLLIKGSNFGSDTSLIRVFVNEKRAPIISSDGSTILAIVPSRADTGYVKIRIGKEPNVKEIVSTNVFNYIFRPVVGTLSGWTDKDGKTAIVDGPLDEAQFEEPYWLAFDQFKNLYLLEEYRALRYIDLHNETVTTNFRTGNGLARPRTIAFNPSYDTMYVANDQWDRQGISTVVLTPATNFTRWTPIIYSATCNGGDAHPQTGDYFYNEFNQGIVYKWIKATGQSQQMYRVDDVNWEFNIQFAPSGDFAYLVVRNRHYILKSKYNRETGRLEAPVHFVGKRGQWGHKDGVGLDVMFDQPQQGAFDEDDNFYVADVFNHCIRKITPEGIVTTFAGRPKNFGYSDGALRDAQFDQPNGIVYDRETGAFYVADRWNHRIRTIIVE